MILHRMLKSHLLRAGIEDEAFPPELENWKMLLELVSAHYEKGDADRHRLERAGDEIRGLYQDLSSERYKLHSVVTSLPLGLGALDAKGRLLFLNPQGEKMLGYSEQELAKGSVLQLIEPELGATLEELVGNGRSFLSHDHGLKAKDGRFVPAVLHINPMLREGKLLGAVMVFDPADEGTSPLEEELLRPPLSELLDCLHRLNAGQLAEEPHSLVEAALAHADTLRSVIGGGAAVDPENSRQVAGLRILLVGPPSATLLGLRRKLSGWGACLAECAGAHEAGALVNEAEQQGRGFDAVIVDGDREGAAQLQEHHPKVIALSAHGEPGTVRKPVHPGELLSVLKAEASFKTEVYPAVGEDQFRVVVVEDDSELTSLMEECVTALNQEFLLVSDLDEAWQLYNEEPVQAIISHWDEDLCRRLREEAGDRHTVLIALTDSAKEAKSARKDGADTALVRPVDKAQLTKALRKAARRRKAAVAAEP